ncbi:hypothetical protein C8R47DRAFT_1063479 [Mycena vitilis]|nr:hypothetical protein C8R47DRAFT_1063479 [Mycena vitilis]
MEAIDQAWREFTSWNWGWAVHEALPFVSPRHQHPSGPRCVASLLRRSMGPDPEWLMSFIAMRASLGAQGRRISELTLSPSPGDIALPIDSPPEIRWLCDGPSPALLDDAAGVGFYFVESDMRVRDFEPKVVRGWKKGFRVGGRRPTRDFYLI